MSAVTKTTVWIDDGRGGWARIRTYATVVEALDAWAFIARRHFPSSFVDDVNALTALEAESPTSGRKLLVVRDDSPHSPARSTS